MFYGSVDEAREPTATRRFAALFAASFLIGSLLVLVGSVPPAAATAPGLNGAIAGYNSGNIYLADPVKHSSRHLTYGYEASWAPSGDLLAVGHGSGMLRIISTTGATLRQIDDPCFRSDPTWSPDGSQIAYSSCSGLSIVNSDGSSPMPIPNTVGFNGAPEWSPNGLWIAMVSCCDDPDIWKIEPDGENLTQVVDRDGVQTNPTWSPDSEQVAFEDWSDPSNNDIHLVDATGGSEKRITTSPARDEQPSWTPRGDRILFGSSRGGGGMFTMTPDGTDVRGVDVPIALGAPAWQPAQITLRASKPIVDAGGIVRLDIRIAGPGTAVPTVVVERRVTDGPWVSWRSLQVDATGRVSVTSTLREHTFYRATWAGDATHPGATSLREQVRVRANVTGHLFREYAREGRIHLYHLGQRIWYTSDIVPPLQDRKMCFRMERQPQRRWVEVFSVCYAIGRSGVTTIYIFNVPVGQRSRVRAYYRGDPKHLADHAEWAYFRVTA